MSPSLLRFRVAVLFVSAACAAESSAGETIRIVNQAQMPVASIRIGGSERLAMKPILPGRSLDLPDVTVTGPIRVDLGFFSGGVRDVLLPDVLLSRGGTVREGEPVRFAVPRLGAQHVAQILTRGIGA